MADLDRLAARLAGRGLLVTGSLALLALVFLAARAERFADLWATAHQQGARALAAAEFRTAAERFAEPFWRGVAWYRAGEFERAAAEFGRVDSPEAALGAGNSQMLLGKYKNAIRNYDRALELREAWPPAVSNRAIAVIRLQRLNPEVEDAGGTGGKLGADEIVIGDAQHQGGSEVTTAGEGEPMTDQELRALWMRRVQTKPADFLRVKFAVQQQRRQTPAAEEDR